MDLRRGIVPYFFVTVTVIVTVIMILAMFIFYFCLKQQDKHCIRHYDCDYDCDKKIRYKYGHLGPCRKSRGKKNKVVPSIIMRF